MFTKTEWDNLLNIGRRENCFDHDIPMGYVLFGLYGMAVHKLIKGYWMHKIVNDWRNKTHAQINAELKNQEWERDYT